MPLFHKSFLRQSAGFTMTELAVALGAIGSIIGAIWVASGSANRASRVQNTTEQVQMIYGSYHSLYSERGVDAPAGVWTDVTCSGVNANYFPQQMIVTGTTCAGGAPPAPPYPMNIWGGEIGVWAVPATQGVAIGLDGLDQKTCVGLASALFNNPGVIGQNIYNATNIIAVSSTSPALTAPSMTETAIVAACAAAGNTIFVEYQAR